MKNWKVTGFLAFLIIGFLLISGCTNNTGSSVAVSTPTPQIVYITVLVTPTPIVTRAQDPIIGVWSDNESYGSKTEDGRIRFNADNTFVFSLFTQGKGTILISGTWIKQGSNSYVCNPQSSSPTTWIYMPKQNTLYWDQYPDMILSPYPGDVMTASSTPVVVSTLTQTAILSQDRDSEFSQAILDSVGKITALLRKISTDVSSKNYMSLKSNAVQLIAQATEDRNKMSAIPVSSKWQGSKTNYLLALDAFVDTGNSISTGADAGKNNDPVTADLAFNTASIHLERANSYMSKAINLMP